MVQIQGHRADTATSSMPKAIILKSFLGSNPSTPEAGQEPAQIPQVRQKSCKKGQVRHRPWFNVFSAMRLSVSI